MLQTNTPGKKSNSLFARRMLNERTVGWTATNSSRKKYHRGSFDVVSCLEAIRFTIRNPRERDTGQSCFSSSYRCRLSVGFASVITLVRTEITFFTFIYERVLNASCTIERHGRRNFVFCPSFQHVVSPGARNGGRRLKCAYSNPASR